MITRKLINKFLIFLYQEHIESYGESLSDLSKGGLLLLDKTFSEKHPEAIVDIDTHTIKDLTYNLGKELEARNFASVDNLSIFLTPEGYNEARRILHPFRYFMANHWKWLIPVLISTIIAFTAIIRLTKCP